MSDLAVGWCGGAEGVTGRADPLSASVVTAGLIAARNGRQLCTCSSNIQWWILRIRGGCGLDARKALRVMDLADLAGSEVEKVTVSLLLTIVNPDQRSVDDVVDSLTCFDPRRGGEDLTQFLFEGRPMRVELVCDLLTYYLWAWDDQGARSLTILYPPPNVVGEDTEHVELVSLAFACAQEVAAAALRAADPQPSAALSRLADAMCLRDHLVAGQLFLFAAELEADADIALAAMERAAAQISMAGERASLASVSCQRVSLVAHRIGDRGVRLLDAIAVALRHIRASEPIDLAKASAVWGIAREAGVNKVMEPLFISLVRDSRDSGKPGWSAVRTEWDTDLRDIADGMRDAPVLIPMENARLTAASELAGEYVHASWETWSFRHPSYHHAVPHGQSIFRESEFGETQLMVLHETTHILSMFSGVGAATMALRTALLDNEIALWGTESLRAMTTLEFRGVRNATPTVQLCARIERSIELLAKLQALRGIWSPWFEGIAVFAELHKDPTSSELTDTASLVLSQLEDATNLAAESVEERTAAALRHLEMADVRYAAAQRDLGPGRLYAYLERNGELYLAGYLAARAVVSTWRATLGVELSGAAAARILLYATRFGTDAVVPDLALPMPQFAERARDAMTVYVAELGKLSAVDLEAVANAEGDSTGRVWVQSGRGVGSARATT